MFDVLFSLFNVSCLAAGLCGAILHVGNVKERMSARDAMWYCVTGMVAANFIAPQMLRIFTVFPIEFISFGVGMAGKPICLKLETWFNKIDLFGKTRNE